jgi:hypothetical protein
MVKTTLTIPEELWKAAKIAAVQEGRDLRDVLLSALERYLKDKRRKEAK